jgi:hypothetical protein
VHFVGLNSVVRLAEFKSTNEMAPFRLLDAGVESPNHKPRKDLRVVSQTNTNSPSQEIPSSMWLKNLCPRSKMELQDLEGQLQLRSSVRGLAQGSKPLLRQHFKAHPSLRRTGFGGWLRFLVHVLKLRNILNLPDA